MEKWMKQLISLCEQYQMMSELTQSELYLLVTGRLSSDTVGAGASSDIQAFLRGAARLLREDRPAMNDFVRLIVGLEDRGY